MSTLKLTRQVQEENSQLLLGRWRWVVEHGSCYPAALDVETTAVLASLDQDQINTASDCAAPLFALAVDDVALANLQQIESLGTEAEDPLARLLINENKALLSHRWMAANQDSTQAAVMYGLTNRTIEWFRGATYFDLERVARSGHCCGRMAVRASYFYHAGRMRHLTQVQRSSLAITSARIHTKQVGA